MICRSGRVTDCHRSGFRHIRRAIGRQATHKPHVRGRDEQADGGEPPGSAVHHQHRKQTRIPSVWDPADVAKILDAIDRGNPCGKRDYAIILLVTRLGLRSIDVKRLEFSDLDWPGNRLSVVQVKTGRRVQLPLPERGRLGGHRLHPRRPAAQRLPTGVPAAHRPDRPVLRPGPPAPDPSQTRPGGPCPGQRETPPRHAFTAAHAGDPADGGRHTHRADRRHPRSPVRPVDRGVSEIIAGPFGQVRTGSG